MDSGKITILGAGNVGSTTAARLAAVGKERICLYDSLHGLAVGKAMDICQASMSTCCTAAEEVSEAIEDSEIVIISAGLPRAKGQKRADLFKGNSRIILDLGQTISEVCPDAFVLIVTNPVDALTTVFNRAFPEIRAYGMGCCLDAQRFRYFLSVEARVSAESVKGLVIGSHNNNMVALTSLATINGKPAREVLSEDQLDAVKKNTREAGTVIVSNLKQTGSYVAASNIICEIATTALDGPDKVYPLNIQCNGEYGIDGCSAAVPVSIGQGASSSVLQLQLEPGEQKALENAAVGIKAVADQVQYAALIRRRRETGTLG